MKTSKILEIIIAYRASLPANAYDKRDASFEIGTLIYEAAKLEDDSEIVASMTLADKLEIEEQAILSGKMRDPNDAHSDIA